MSSLVLEWQEDQQTLTRRISGEKAPRNRSITIGRDSKCDIPLKDPTKTISGVHVGIFFDENTNNFHLVNLTRDRPQPNPATIVDGKRICSEEAILHIGSKIELGKALKLQVKDIEKQIQRKSKCSDPKAHILPLEYLHGNCPFDGSVVMEEIEV